jgi:ParB-like chromosome segregation protein Spo0J
MSRGRRRTREGSGALTSLEQAANAIYSSELPPDLAEIDSRRRMARPVSIFEIYPDRTQPRRVVPSVVRQHWDGDPHTTATLFDAWLHEIERLVGAPLDLAGYLEQAYLPDDVEGNDGEADMIETPLKPVEKALLGLADLAVSIRRDGLLNPVTVAREGRFYRLETGERRWLAYHLLHLYYPDEDWSRMPAHLVEAVSVWRQASENNARADLNAIGRARQLAILLMDLLAERGLSFRSLDEVLAEGLSERVYYAQVADGTVYRVPRGEGERLLSAMGLKNPTQLRQYRNLLRLPDELWREADDQNWTEWDIRKRDTVTAVTVSAPVTASERQVNPFVERINRRRRDHIWVYANRLDNLSPEECEKALTEIEADERWLAELKQAIRRRTS